MEKKVESFLKSEKMMYEKQGSKLEGKIETAKILFKAGKLTVEDAVKLLHISKEEVLSWKR